MPSPRLPSLPPPEAARAGPLRLTRGLVRAGWRHGFLLLAACGLVSLASGVVITRRMTDRLEILLDASQAGDDLAAHVLQIEALALRVQMLAGDAAHAPADGPQGALREAIRALGRETDALAHRKDELVQSGWLAPDDPLRAGLDADLGRLRDAARRYDQRSAEFGGGARPADLHRALGAAHRQALVEFDQATSAFVRRLRAAQQHQLEREAAFVRRLRVYEAGSAAAAILTAVFLLLHGRRLSRSARRQAARESARRIQLARRERYLTALIELNQRLLQAPDDAVVHEQVLEPIALAACADRAFVCVNEEEPGRGMVLRTKAEWVAAGVPRIMSERPELASAPYSGGLERWWVEMLNDRPIHALTRDLSEREREELCAKSVLMLPLFVRGRLYGLIGFALVHEERLWGHSEVDLLAAAASALGTELSRRTTERELHERETTFARIVEHSSDVMLRVDLRPDPVLTFASPSVEDVTGFTLEELYRDPLLAWSRIEPEDCERLRRHLKRAVDAHPPPVRCRFQHREGRTLQLEVNMQATPDAVGRTSIVYAVVRDVTEHHRVSETLERTEASFRTLIDDLPDGVVVQHDGRIVYANPAARSLLGLWHHTDGVGRALAAFAPEEARPAFEAHLAQAMASQVASAPFQARLVGGGARVSTVEVVSLPLTFDGLPSLVSILRDMTERHQMQGQLLLADRLASLGTLSAGLAHEINNPIAYAVANVRFAMDEVQRRSAVDASLSELADALRDAHDGCTRVSRIVRDLRTFSRADDSTSEEVDVDEVLEQSLNLAASTVRRRARVVRDYETVPRVRANAGRLGQVFLNLIVNAAQSLPEGGAMDNEIRLGVHPERGGVRVTVEDTGCGIPPEHVPRIFDPFFTTKPVGEGTGLGLPICHGIVTTFGGRIEVKSKPGAGTTMTVHLPAPAASPLTGPGEAIPA